jgi:ribosomal protein S12 methylthiotransferase
MATQAPEIDGVCLVNDFGPGDARPGEMRRLRVTEAHDYDLVGELVDAREQLYTPAPQAAGLFSILPSVPRAGQRVGQSIPAR